MDYGFQPAEIIPLSYISYRAVFPTPGRQRPGPNGLRVFPVLSVVRPFATRQISTPMPQMTAAIFG